MAWARAKALVIAIACVGGGVGSAATNAPAAPPAAAAPASAARWVWPVASSRIAAGFQAPPGPYAAGHRGIDLAATAGAPVRAPAAGSLVVAQTVVDRPVVTLRLGEHLLISIEPVAATVPVDATVAAGQQIGVAGTGGHCEARCVHLGVRVDGEYVSPLLFLAGVPPAVLLPVD